MVVTVVIWCVKLIDRCRAYMSARKFGEASIVRKLLKLHRRALLRRADIYAHGSSNADQVRYPFSKTVNQCEVLP